MDNELAALDQAALAYGRAVLQVKRTHTDEDRRAADRALRDVDRAATTVRLIEKAQP